jgi:hypothetical protein
MLFSIKQLAHSYTQSCDAIHAMSGRTEASHFHNESSYLASWADSLLLLLMSFLENVFAKLNSNIVYQSSQSSYFLCSSLIRRQGEPFFLG